MNCYECSMQDTTSTVIGVCSQCGAALCREHVTACVSGIVHTTAVGSPTIHDPAGRSLCCATCRDAGTDAVRRLH